MPEWRITRLRGEFCVTWDEGEIRRRYLTFTLTPIGCGLAGYSPAQIAWMFDDAPPNVLLPAEFKAPSPQTR